MYEVVSIKGDIITFKIPFFKSDVWNDCDIADDIAVIGILKLAEMERRGEFKDIK